jgi:hypothetical protein
VTPNFVSEAIKKNKKLFRREMGSVELTMMEASNSDNNDSNGEILVILVCIESNSHWNEGY